MTTRRRFTADFKAKVALEAYDAGRPVDMMDKPDGLPTYPPAQQQQQDVINRILAA